jgi:predicted GTPase
MKPLVAIVGRPNVGKSLFSTEYRPPADSISRIRRRHPGQALCRVRVNGVKFDVVDTGGN